ncbi:hypothetical protein Tco_0805535 [Tanacetum coccineum]
MKRGFLSQKESGSGRGVKEKDNVVSNIEVVKDGVVPYVTVDYGSGAKEVVSPSVVDETMTKEKKSSLVDTTLRSYPPSPTQGTTTAGNTPGKSSYANVTGKPRGGGNGIGVVVTVESIRAIIERFANTAYGFFLGKRVAYPVVANYVRNTWDKYGPVRSMFSSSTGLFSFQFSSIDGLDAMLENGPWFIRNEPLILRKWHPDVNLMKEDVGTIPVCVKLHGVPIKVFNEDGLSATATKLGDVELKDNIVMVMPKITGEGYYTCNIRVSMSGNLIGVRVVENDVELGTNGETSNLASQDANSSGSSFWNVDSSSPSTTLIIKKIDKIEKMIIDEKVTLVDDEGKPLEKIDYSGDYNSEDGVASVDNEMASFLAKNDGYDTQSLLEQWKESYENDDYEYDPYVDDMYEGQEISEKLQAICDNLNIRVRVRRKK